MQVKRIIPFLTMVLGLLMPLTTTWAHINPNARPAGTSTNDGNNTQINFRANCDNAVSQIEQEVNNVRARLTTGGDVWWDGSDGRYVVPKPPPGGDEVSSIFAGAVWLGGVAPGGDLKVAAQQYGRSGGNFDFYPGPLTAEGTIGQDTCSDWDRFFVVDGQNIRDFRALYFQALESNALPLDVEDIPADILGWPALGNRYFFDIIGFELPTSFQGLGGFWDEDGDGIYDPTFGDFPIIEIRGCEVEPQFAEEMTFWIYNDAGNIHAESGTPTQIRMEVQVQAFAFTTADDINNMTFQRYKLINRATEDILETYFAMWVDPDLGCFEDDYVGCDTTRDLAFIYNEDDLDGSSGTTCASGVATYEDEIPLLGVDYFRGPLDENGDELGMSSFIYINGGGGNPPGATTDPDTRIEYYNFLQGIWKDGSPLEVDGDGYDEGTLPTRYAFPNEPNNNDGWSMCTAGLENVDRRTLQASGPFTLVPGAVNELIIGVVWVPDQVYPCPSLRRLQQADDIAQDLFDACFELLEGPDAPDVDWVELDREIIALLSNNPGSNNLDEEYEQEGLGIPPGEDSLYRFEGYRIFQYSDPEVSLADIDDPDKVRIVAEVDIQNGVNTIFNWTGLDPEDPAFPVPTSDIYYVPELRVAGKDEGIQHSFRITQDAFGQDDGRLINHRRYYFTAIAYGYNNYQQFDPETGLGQLRSYLPSSRNIGPNGDGVPYTVIPRPIVDLDLNAQYGDEPMITRLAGKGNYGNFLDFTEETVEAIESAFATDTLYRDGRLTYQTGAGPLNVKVVNPRTVMDGSYEILFEDDDITDDEYTGGVNWVLRCTEDCGVAPIVSDTTIDLVNEQIIAEFGISVTIANLDEPGAAPVANPDNGGIGAAITYADPQGSRWLSFIPDGFSPGIGFAPIDNNVYNYVSNGLNETEFDTDPRRALSSLLPGAAPLKLMKNELDPEGAGPFLISPAWRNIFGTAARENTEITDLNNVNIVFTSNKDLWSRCPVIETRNGDYDGFEPNNFGMFTNDAGVVDPDDQDNLEPIMFDTRGARSVSKEAGPDGLPLPIPDEDINPEFRRGMGWFPGYAIDVETGQRLAIYFGENSVYDGRELPLNGYIFESNGADMMWNPSSTIFEKVPGLPLTAADFPSGGQHYIYVTTLPYVDYSLTSGNAVRQEALRSPGGFLESRFDPSTGPTPNRKARVLTQTTWALFPVLAGGEQLLSYADGLIPNDVTVKLRVDSKFDYAEGVEEFNGHGAYQFTIDGQMAGQKDAAGKERALDMINVVPNPYYATSIYEDNVFDKVVKITNLPPRATVSIYSLDGKFIRQYNRDEAPAELRNSSTRPIGTRQITPALEWDLNNFAGIPVASGVYLIHVDAPEGERTLKLFVVNRQFDPSGL